MAGRTFIFFPEGAYGPTNNCVGIGDVLRRRGHRVVFIAEESFEGTLAAKGFEERLMRLNPPSEAGEDPGQFWKDFIRDTAPVFRKPTIEQLEGFIGPTFEALCDGARYVDERLVEIIGEVEPDVIVEDNVVSFPALPASGRPWVRIVSCNPAEVKDPDVPPTFSGYPVADRSDWDAYRDGVRARARAAAGRVQRVLRAARGAAARPPRVHPHLPGPQPLALSERGRLRALAARSATAGATSSRAFAPPTPPGSCRSASPPGAGPLVYLSLGSLGSADVELMRTLIAALADSPYRVIVSKGPQHDELELAENMAGAEFLPQTSVLPQVDLVITHGGNNTVTECLHFGKPMVAAAAVLGPVRQRPADRRDRVRRPPADTTRTSPPSCGRRSTACWPTGRCAAHLDAVSRRLRSRRGTERAADLIESVAD